MTARKILSLPFVVVSVALSLVCGVGIGLPGRLLSKLEMLLVRHVAYPAIRLKRRIAGDPLWQPQDWGIGIPPPIDHPEYREPGITDRDQLDTEGKAQVDRMSKLFAAFDNPDKVLFVRGLLDSDDKRMSDMAAIWLTARDTVYSWRVHPNEIAFRVKKPITCPNCDAEIGLFDVTEQSQADKAWKAHIEVCTEIMIRCAHCHDFSCRLSEKEKQDAHDMVCPKSPAAARIRELEAMAQGR